MTAKEPTTQEVVFKPRARLVDTIGADLIKDEMAGIIELVKNAYDADATKVKIRFNDLTDPEKASIVVEDDGHGMTLKTILEHWLSPSTDDKGKRKTSPGERPLLGRKGVGRFAAMRLGDELVLETTPEGIGERYRLKVGWKKFLGSDLYLDQVKFPLQTFHDVQKEAHWTRLRISGLLDVWNDRRLRPLVGELRALLTPLPHEPQEKFSIYFDLTSSGLDDETVSSLSRKVEPYDAPDIADYTLEAKIDKNGSYRFEYRRLLYKHDKEELAVCKKPEENEDIRQEFSIDDLMALFGGKLVREGFDFPLPLPCGSLKMHLAVWDRDRELLAKKADQFGQSGISAIRRTLDELSGVAIYRDGFRVRPYGDQNVDWLGLGQRRVQSPVRRLGPNQLRGTIEISSIGNPKLEDKSSREGLKENDAYMALCACVLAVLGWAEPTRYRFRKRNQLGRPAPKSTRTLVEERTRIFKELKSRMDEAIKEEKILKNVHHLAAAAEKNINEEHKRIREQAEMLHDNHALGILTGFVVHEGRNIDSALDSALSNVESCASRSRKTKQDPVLVKGDDLPVFDTSLTAARRAENSLDGLIDQLDPLTRPRRGRRPKIVVEKIAGRVVSIFYPQLRDAGIRINMPSGQHEVLAWEADIFHAIFNLLHNSIYWVQRVLGPREIAIEIRPIKGISSAADEKHSVEILVHDTGPGVSEKIAPDIFDLGYSERGGTGVGLFIARESIERSRGTLELVNPGEPGAKFRIVLEGA